MNVGRRLGFVLVILLPVGIDSLIAQGEQSVREFELLVRLPYEQVLRDEIVKATVQIQNQGREPVTALKNGATMGGRQLAFIPWKDGQFLGHQGMLLSEKYVRSPEEVFSQKDFDSIYISGETETVPPGAIQVFHEVIITTWNRTLYEMPDEIQPVFYGGGGKLLYGEGIPITVVPNRVRDYPLVFKALFSPNGGATNARVPIEIFEVPIGDERFLFSNDGTRFCRIPKSNDAYEISFAQRGRDRLVTVKFDGEVDSLTYNFFQYQLVSGARETVPWLWAADQGIAQAREIEFMASESGNQLEANSNLRDGPFSDRPKQSTSPVEQEGYRSKLPLALLSGLVLLSIASARYLRRPRS